MTPHDFKSSWANNNSEQLSPLSRTRVDRFKLLQSTADFLILAGLPVYCEPILHFATCTDDIFSGINKLTNQHNFESNKEMYEKYVVIGSCRDGDAIAIDTMDNDKIVELDHEDLFRPMYFNSSITTLAEFLLLYRDFEQEVLQGKNPADNFQCYNFTDQQFDELRDRMIAIDSKAVTERGFWSDELEIMLSIRQQKYGQI